ncbi:hypothetical protein [Undibacterium umbellatum]|uniref:Uncharacterized protein n=1 Tax=Undibacterium umbellatum TaxID=2762300 RepID=A0ABR6ZIQ8_9BURK|nr:hypothetical protein [Undibacterium umbellatum]MBC3911230.1 hypothetical protein [Undibacterium umbellatum]
MYFSKNLIAQSLFIRHFQYCLKSLIIILGIVLTSGSQAYRPVPPTLIYESVSLNGLKLIYKTAFENEGFILTEENEIPNRGLVHTSLVFNFPLTENCIRKVNGNINLQITAEDLQMKSESSKAKCQPCRVTLGSISSLQFPDISMEERDKLYTAMSNALKKADEQIKIVLPRKLL